MVDVWHSQPNNKMELINIYDISLENLKLIPPIRIHKFISSWIDKKTYIVTLNYIANDNFSIHINLLQKRKIKILL